MGNVPEGEKRTLDAKSPDLHLQPNATGAKSQKSRDLSRFLSAAHDIPATQPIPCIGRCLTATSQVHQLVHLQHDARADAHLRRFNHPALSMFLTPGPSFSRSISM